MQGSLKGEAAESSARWWLSDWAVLGIIIIPRVGVVWHPVNDVRDKKNIS